MRSKKTAGAGETEHVAAALGLAPGHDLLTVETTFTRRIIRGRGQAGGDLRNDPLEFANDAIGSDPVGSAKPAAQDVLTAEDVKKGS